MNKNFAETMFRQDAVDMGEQLLTLVNLITDADVDANANANANAYSDYDVGAIA